MRALCSDRASESASSIYLQLFTLRDPITWTGILSETRHYHATTKIATAPNKPDGRAY